MARNIGQGAKIMENENQTVTAPADNGLEAKMDKILADVEAREQKAAETLQAAKDAQEKAEKALNEAVAAKNAHSVNFAPAAKKADKTETNKNFRDFLGQVKAAKYGAKAALSTDATTGSYLVPQDFLPQLFDFLAQYPAFVNDATRIPWGSFGNERHIPQLVSRPAVNVTAEGAQKTLSNPAFGLIEQKLEKLTALVVWTRELAEDAGIYLPDYLPAIVGPQFTIQLNKWLFQGITNHPGIVNASGIVTPVSVDSVNKVADLKWAIPYQYRANGKFYIETSLYGQLASIARLSAPSWLTYENGVMRIDGSDVVAVDPELIGNGIALFGDMKTVIFSPRNEIQVKYSDQANITDGGTTHQLFQENKEAYLFELRADISVVGSVWAKADLGESDSES
jgi:HK97 family phage major capsid protein